MATLRHIAVVLLLVLVGCVVAPSGGGAAALPSFTGFCNFSGVETFAPPLVLQSRPGAASVAASGRCSGRLVDTSGNAHSVAGVAATYRQTTNAATISCIGGTARGAGVVTIDGTALTFSVTEPQLTVLSTLQFTAAAWSGYGFASVAPSANPLALALACIGSGIVTVPVVVITYSRAL